MMRGAACLMNKNLRKWMPRILVFWVALTTLLPFFVSVFIIPMSSTTSTSNTSTLHQQHPTPSSSNQRGDAADEVGGDITTPRSRSDTISNVCLTRECIHSTASRLARAYPDKTNRSAWIININNDNRLFESNVSTNYNTTSSSTYCAGIIYVKNFKAASSTAAGIALRIAYRYSSSSSSSYSSDNHSHSHAWVKFSHVRGFKYAHRDVSRSILFTSLRDPAARAISRIFYTSMTQMGELPTDENILQKLRWNHRQYGAVSHQGGGYQVRYCSMHKELPTSWSPSSSSSENGTNSHNIVINPAQVERNVQEIIDAYDFIMVAERMDESVVALALILGLEDSLGDVLVMDAKQNTATAGGGKNNNNNNNNNYLYFSHRDSKTKRMVETCRLSVPAFRSPAVQAHLQSTEWYAKNYGDYLLHAAALQSLDRTIARLGNERFESALTEYRRLKQKAQQQCSNETISHCSSNGTIQRDLSQKNCYSDDSGCGHECIDRMLLLLAEDAKKGHRQQTTTTTTTNKKRKF